MCLEERAFSYGDAAFSSEDTETFFLEVELQLDHGMTRRERRAETQYLNLVSLNRANLDEEIFSRQDEEEFEEEYEEEYDEEYESSVQGTDHEEQDLAITQPMDAMALDIAANNNQEEHDELDREAEELDRRLRELREHRAAIDRELQESESAAAHQDQALEDDTNQQASAPTQTRTDGNVNNPNDNDNGPSNNLSYDDELELFCRRALGQPEEQHLVERFSQEVVNEESRQQTRQQPDNHSNTSSNLSYDDELELYRRRALGQHVEQHLVQRFQREIVDEDRRQQTRQQYRANMAAEIRALMRAGREEAERQQGQQGQH